MSITTIENNDNKSSVTKAKTVYELSPLHRFIIPCKISQKIKSQKDFLHCCNFYGNKSCFMDKILNIYKLCEEHLSIYLSNIIICCPCNV